MRPVKSDTESLWSEELDQALGFLIADTARYAKRLLYACIAQQGIRGGSWYLLRALWHQDGITQRELAERLGITEPSVQEMLRAMETDGLIERKRDPLDRRKLRIHLTAHARELKDPLMAIAEGLNRSAAADLSQAEELLLRRMLKQIRSRLAEEFDKIAAVDATHALPLDLREEASVSERLPKPSRRKRPAK